MCLGWSTGYERRRGQHRKFNYSKSEIITYVNQFSCIAFSYQCLKSSQENPNPNDDVSLAAQADISRQTNAIIPAPWEPTESEAASSWHPRQNCWSHVSGGHAWNSHRGQVFWETGIQVELSGNPCWVVADRGGNVIGSEDITNVRSALNR